MLKFDRAKQEVVEREITGGRFITAEEHDALLAEPPPVEES
jgi:hypothetical protein